jgi:oxygen-independent coproporphyrinogen-3 oxidase
MTKAFREGTAHYGASGHQTGGRVNFVAVGSSAKGNLGDDYYSQSYYDLPSYKRCLDKREFPTFRGMKLSKDDKIRQHVTQQFRSYFKIDFKQFKRNFKINFEEYFSKEIEYLGEMIKDGLVTVSNDGIKMTELGRDFSQNISNVFDKYDPPTKSYNERLATIKKAKLAQAKAQELI